MTKLTLKKFVAAALAAALSFSSLTGCSVKGPGAAPTDTQVEQKASELNELSRPKIVQVIDRPYLGATSVRREVQEDAPVLRQNVVLKQRGSLKDVAVAISAIAPVYVQIEDNDAEPAEKPKGIQEPDVLDLNLPALDLGKNALDIAYRGSLRGLLDSISSQSGYGWDYDKESNRITFSAMVVRTFTILAAPGRVAFESQVSNKSKERSSSSSFSGNVNSTQQTGDASAQTTQIHKTKFDVDVWREVKENCEKLLSRDGKVVLDQAAGTVTVRDRYVRVRDIASYIDQLNERLSRQVAVTVRVWSLELDDNNDVGLNLQALFEAGDTSVVSGSLSRLGGAGTAAVSVVKGRLKGSSGTIKALKEWGKATQLTSGGGLLVNNQPLPIQAVQRHAYIAGMTLATSEYNQTSEITPGEVSTGFSMTIVPHILKDRRVILQYNLTMSSLENMKEVDRDSVYVQLPETYTRSFSQRSRMKMGETLVLAGFEQTRQVNSNSVGILSTGRNTEYGRTLIIVTIELESAESV